MRLRSSRPRALPLLLALVLLAPVAAGAVLRKVFVTSVSGMGNLSAWPDAGGAAGLAGGDAICRARAAAAGLDNAATFRAWLSTSTVDAYCHVLGLTGTKLTNCNGAVGTDPPAGPWARVDEQPFAARLALMTSAGGARVYQPLRYDEYGTDLDWSEARVWTGTGADGRRYSFTCENWSSADPADHGDSGSACAVGLFWTYYSSVDCDQELRLICFEPGQGEAQRVPATAGALAFLSSAGGRGDLAEWFGVPGLAGADASCQGLAANAGLPYPDSFVAWMSDSSTDAIERVTFLGPWVRVDGFPLALTRAEMLGTSGMLLTGLNVDEGNGYHHGTMDFDDLRAWTGTDDNGQATAFNCSDWTSVLGDDLGSAGDFDIARRYSWTMSGFPSCNQVHRLYCFSNQPLLFWDNFERGDALKWSLEVG